jgi:hypothetical protein
VSYWKEIDDLTNLQYNVVGGTQVNVTTHLPSSFLQVEGGLSFAETSISATGFVKGAYKEGTNISGSSLVLGGRLNF